MPILLYFFIVLLIIRLTKIETKLGILLALIITYLSYRSPQISNIIKSATSSVSSKDEKIESIPSIITKDWFIYWKEYFYDIKEYNHENYYDVMKSVKHFHQLYNQIFSGIELPAQHLDNLSMLQKEILNTLQSTIYSIPATKGETLDNILSKKIDHLKEELNVRIKELRKFINKDWNDGKISYQSTPIYPNTLVSLPSDYSSNYSFY